MSNVAIIPVRLKSDRFPEKHLQRVSGKPILDRVIEYTKSLEFIDHIVLATEDDKLESYKDQVDEFFLMKPDSVRCGAERAYEYFKRNQDFNRYITIPADEPYINNNSLESAFRKCDAYLENEEIATFYTKFYNEEDLRDKRSCKITLDEDRVLYFSRSIIPIRKDGDIAELSVYNKHVGVFVFSHHFLKFLGEELWGDWKSELADIESLEQNRFLQFGIDVRAYEMKHIGFGIDTADQIQKMEERLKENNIV